MLWRCWYQSSPLVSSPYWSRNSEESHLHFQLNKCLCANMLQYVWLMMDVFIFLSWNLLVCAFKQTNKKKPYLYTIVSKEPQSAFQCPYPILIHFPIHLHSAAVLQCLVYYNVKSARMFISIYTVFHKRNKYDKQFKVQNPSAIAYITGCYFKKCNGWTWCFSDIPGASNIRSICSSILLKLLTVAKKWVMGTIVLWQIEKGVISILSSYHVRMPINCHTSLAKRLFVKTERFLFIQLFTVL